MRIANVAERLALITGDLAVDVAGASGGRFGPDVQSDYDDFDAFCDWAASADLPPGRSSRTPTSEHPPRRRGNCSPSASTTARTPKSLGWPPRPHPPSSPSSSPRSPARTPK